MKQKDNIVKIEQLILENFHKVSSNLGMKTTSDNDFYLVTHNDFKKLYHFDSKPDYDMVGDVISKLYNKKVVDYIPLDRENTIWKFEDGSEVELLLRLGKYVD